MLFGGRKFDMRIYALCLSYQPLTIYLYRVGFARFAHDRYDNSDLDNLCNFIFLILDKHLTNVAINMNAPTYVKRIGGKWFLDRLKNFMLSKYINFIIFLDMVYKKLMKHLQIYKDV